MNQPYTLAFPSQGPPMNLATGERLSPEEEEAMGQFSTACELESLNLLPNFQFKYLTGPSGFSASVPLDRLVNADLMRCDLFRVVSAIRLKMASHQWEGRSQELESLRLLFPLQGHPGPSVAERSSVHSSWVPSLGGRQTSVAVCQHLTRDAENRQHEEYYLVCHSSLPDSYLADVQEEMERLSRDNADFKRAYREKGAVRQDLHPVEWAKVVQAGGLLHQAKEVALENNRRVLDIFSQMAGLDLQVHLTEHSLEWPVVGDKEMDQLDPQRFDAAMKWWPKGVPIFPFTALPRGDGPLYPRPEIQGFPLGACFWRLRGDQAQLDKLKAKYQADFRLRMRAFEPQMVTVYNTYQVGLGGVLEFHSMAAPTSADFLMYEGVDLGYRVYNRGSGHMVDWKNMYLDTFPVAFPFREEQCDVKEDLLFRCFTPTKGGHGNTQAIPEQLLGKTIGVDSLLVAGRYLNTPQSIQLHTLKVFLSPDTFNISSFPIN